MAVADELTISKMAMKVVMQKKIKNDTELVNLIKNPAKADALYTEMSKGNGPDKVTNAALWTFVTTIAAMVEMMNEQPVVTNGS